ncbi:ABC transporter ATP-binding protein [Pseudochrobactrum sp. HB0163]|uniref:ABC transporter ATP-binding protein n=1 Tax=Pseudochrobactrum sp. HB0163 TaxID=3450708 RepID=UPI003F6E1AAC
MAGLNISRISKSFNGTKVLQDVSLDIANGEFIAVLGPSGCGKTTLLRMIAGFEQADDGVIYVGDTLVTGKGQFVPPEKRRVGIVFQNYALWPHMTVAENVGYSLKITGVEKAERARRVEEALKLVDLQGYGTRRPANLSGGQRQRVALARCLVAAPSLVLFDEPLANLDVHLRASMEDEFARFHKRTGTTIVYITHDQAEAMALADRIAVMDKGKLVQFATPQTLYNEPANAMVASFIAQGMVLPAEILKVNGSGACEALVLGERVRLRCRPDEVVRKNAQICVREDDLEMVRQGGFAVRVRRSVYQGGGSRIEAYAVQAPELSLHFKRADPFYLKADDVAHLTIRSGWVLPQSVAQAGA